MCFNSFSHLFIFPLPCCILDCFNSCHHAATRPWNFVASKEIRRSSRTPLKSRISPTAATHSKNSSGWRPPWNFGISSLKLDSPINWHELLQGVDAHALRAPQKGSRIHSHHFVRLPPLKRAVRVYVDALYDHPHFVNCLVRASIWSLRALFISHCLFFTNRLLMIIHVFQVCKARYPSPCD